MPFIAYREKQMASPIGFLLIIYFIVKDYLCRLVWTFLKSKKGIDFFCKKKSLHDT